VRERDEKTIILRERALRTKKSIFFCSADGSNLAALLIRRRGREARICD